MFLQPLTDRAGVAAVLTIIMALVLWRMESHYPCSHVFHHDIDSPVVALEISHTPDDINAVLHRNDKDEEQAPLIEHVIWLATLCDLFFIPCYAFFLWASARLFINRMQPLTILIGAMVLFDYMENWQIFRALDGANPAIYIPSLIKWGLFALVLLWTAIVLLRSSEQVYSLETRRLLGIAYLVSGLLIAIAVVAGDWIGYSFIELGTHVFSVLVLIHAVGLLGPYLALRGITQQYVPDYCEQRHRLAKQGRAAVEPRPAK
jgi:hypothetical protein